MGYVSSNTSTDLAGISRPMVKVLFIASCLLAALLALYFLIWVAIGRNLPSAGEDKVVRIWPFAGNRAHERSVPDTFASDIYFPTDAPPQEQRMPTISRTCNCFIKVASLEE